MKIQMHGGARRRLLQALNPNTPDRESRTTFLFTDYPALGLMNRLQKMSNLPEPLKKNLENFMTIQEPLEPAPVGAHPRSC